MNNRIIAILFVGLVAIPLASIAQVSAVDGGLGVYDPANNLTWTANGNLFGSQYSTNLVNTIISDANSANSGAGLSTGIVSSSDFKSAGTMTWQGANAWVHYLDAINYSGSNQWALPTTVDSISSNGYPNGLLGYTGTVPNVSISSSQMAMLFYGQLGEMTGAPITTTNNGNTGYALFNNLQSYAYWSGTEFSGTNGSVAWDFNTMVGSQGGDGKAQAYYALAVAPGDIAAPELDASSAAGGITLLLGGIAVVRGRRRERTTHAQAEAICERNSVVLES